MYEDAWATIRSRGIEAAPTNLLRAVDLQPVVDGRAVVTVETTVKGFLGVGDNGSSDLDKTLPDLFNVMDAEYEHEEQFSQELFYKIAECFRRGGWDVACGKKKPTRISAARVKRLPLRLSQEDRSISEERNRLGRGSYGAAGSS